MITSVVDICNMALDYCNVRTITAIDEDTKQARICSRWYDTVRRSLLMNMNASFSLKRAVLVQVINFTPVYGYTKAYNLPQDCLKVLNVGSPTADNFYQIEGNYIYVTEDIPAEDVKIRYIADVQDVTKFDAEFADCLALKLAEKICLPLSEDEQKTSLLKQLAQQKYVETSTKYGHDNKMIIINKPKYRQSKIYAEIEDTNYYAK